jgi:hypothetical protein
MKKGGSSGWEPIVLWGGTKWKETREQDDLDRDRKCVLKLPKERQKPKLYRTKSQ